MIAGLLIVGLASHSLGVLAAGGDFVADSAAIVLGIIAIQVTKHPRGSRRATTFAALINAFVLLVVLWFGVESRRFKGPPIGADIARRAAEIAAAEKAVGEAA